MPNLLSTSEVAAIIGTHSKTVIAYAQANKLPGSYIARKWRFRYEDVQAFVSSQRRSK